MEHTWLSLIPPLVILVLACLSRNIIFSLIIGIITAALLASNFSPLSAIMLVAEKILEKSGITGLLQATDFEPLYIFGFLITLGILTELMTHGGGIRASTRLLRRYLTTKKATQRSSLLLSSFFFLDDYLNNLMVGNIMRPLTDAVKIPRVKLAFFLNCMSSSLCILIPLSSWLAFIVPQLQANGISTNNANNPFIFKDTVTLYVQSLGYFIYPILSIFTAWSVAWLGISFGAMKKQEEIAEKTGNVFGGKPPLHHGKNDDAQPSAEGSLIDFFFPTLMFIGMLKMCLLYKGGFFADTQFFKAIYRGTTTIFWALFVAALITLVATSILYALKKKTSLNSFSKLALRGFFLMKNPIIVLTLAWTFGSILKEHLHLGEHIASLLLGSLSTSLLPLSIFFTTMTISAVTGSAWGTIAVTLPLAMAIIKAIVPVPLNNDIVTIVMPTLGALFSGSIAGSHLSPVTDATIMASTAAGAYHLDHVKTHIPYVLPAVLATMISYGIIGALKPQTTSMLIVILLTAVCITLSLLLMQSRFSKKEI